MADGDSVTPKPDTQGTPNSAAKPVEPVKEGGVSDAITEIMQERVFSGHPADQGAEGKGDNGPGDGEQGTPEVKAEPPAGEGGEQKVEAPAGEEAKFEPKHKTWEETEKARREAERSLHEKATKASDLEKENQRLKDDAETVKQELEALKTKPKPQEPPNLDSVVDRYAQALAKAGELNTYDADYNKKVAKIMVEAGFAGQSAPDPAILQELIAEQVETRVKEAVKNVRGDQDKEADAARNLKRIHQVAEDEGLNMKEGSPDYKAFWAMAKDADPSKTLEEQSKWAANEVKALKGAFRQGYQQELKTGEEHQTNNEPMGRGGTRPPAPPAKKEPFSINNILAGNARKI